MIADQIQTSEIIKDAAVVGNQSAAMTEAEVIGLAAEAMRELVETKYPYTERYFRMFGEERLPPVMKADMKRRERLLAAAKKLEQMIQW